MSEELKPRYYLHHKLLGEKEVTVEQFMEAERRAGFRPKFPGKPATGGFGFGDISGSVRYGSEAPAAQAVDEDSERRKQAFGKWYAANPYEELTNATVAWMAYHEGARMERAALNKTEGQQS